MSLPFSEDLQILNELSYAKCPRCRRDIDEYGYANIDGKTVGLCKECKDTVEGLEDEQVNFWRTRADLKRKLWISK